MLKSIATSRSECLAKQENKVIAIISYNTDYIAPDSIEFFGDEKRSKRRLKKKKNSLIVKNILMAKNWFVGNF